MLDGQQVERGLAAAGVDAPGGSRRRAAARRRAGRRSRRASRAVPSRSSCRYGAISATHESSAEAERHDQRVDDARAVALRVAAADEHQQPGHQRRVDEDVGAVARSTGTAPPRRTGSGSCRCRGRRARTARSRPRTSTRRRRGRAVQAHADEDRDDGRQAEHVHQRAAAGERRHRRRRARTAPRRRPGRACHGRERPRGVAAAHGHAALRELGVVAGVRSSPRSASCLEAVDQHVDLGVACSRR